MQEATQVTRRLRPLAVLAATVLMMAFISAGPASAGGDSHHGDHHDGGHHDSVDLTINQDAGSAVSVEDSSLRAGVVSVKIDSKAPDTPGHDIEIFQLHDTTLDELRAQIAKAFDRNTPGPEVGQIVQVWINQHSTIYGGFQSQTAGVLKYDVVLPAGDYYAIDLNTFLDPNAPAVANFSVKGKNKGKLDAADQSLNMAGEDTFVLDGEHGRLEADTLSITNTTPDLHFVDFQPVKPGTTNDDVTASFTGGPDPSAGTAIGTGVISPGIKINLLLDVPAGTYAAVCFMPDKETGVPHALPPMNMHIVTDVVSEEGDDD
jgi:hypothetical protein